MKLHAKNYANRPNGYGDMMYRRQRQAKRKKEEKNLSWTRKWPFLNSHNFRTKWNFDMRSTALPSEGHD